MIAIDPGATGGFAARMTALAAAATAEPGTRLPGTSRLARREAAHANGVTVPTSQIDRIRAL